MGSDRKRDEAKSRDRDRDRDRVSSKRRRSHSRERERSRSRERNRPRHRDRDRRDRDPVREKSLSLERRVKREHDEEHERRVKEEFPGPAEVKRERRNSEERGPRDDRRQRHRRRFDDNEDDREYEFGKREVKNEDEKDEKVEEKKKPDFGLSGKLTEDTNTYRGVVIKYSEPPEARKPKRKWRLYVFKGEESLPHIEIHRQSAYLLGRDRKVADIPIDHPSSSKQHAALQYRMVPFTREDGTTGRRVRPYIMDLESANGTFVNNQRIEPRRYVELLEKDMIKFGYSSREYILLHADSAESGDEGEEGGVSENPAN
jgi:smad nuclear-interacting protein 1